MKIDVGTEFHRRLTNRDKLQGDGRYTAVQFRERFLNSLDNQEYWKQDPEPIILDFKNVEKIGPSFANEAFAYFTKYAKPEVVLSKIKFENITTVQRILIEQEIKSGYCDRK